MELFDFSSRFMQTSDERLFRSRMCGISRVNRLGVLLADIGDTEEFGLSASAADGEVQGSVLADGAVGQRQRRARDELFLRRLVAAARRLDVDGVHRAEGPIANVKSLLVLGGELRAVPELDADRRAGANVD